MCRPFRERRTDCHGDLAVVELLGADQQHHVDEIFGSGVRSLASWQRIRMKLFRKLLFGRNDRKRGRLRAAEAEPVPAGHHVLACPDRNYRGACASDIWE